MPKTLLLLSICILIPVVVNADTVRVEGQNPAPDGAIVGRPLPASGGGGPRQVEVAIVADSADNLADVRQKILDTGKVSSVATYDVAIGPVPTLVELLAYDAVLVWGGTNSWGAAVNQSLGDVLADYADAGGGVVTATFCIGSNLGSWILTGRWSDVAYHVLEPAMNQQGGQEFLGAVLQPAHPIMTDVVAFDGGSSSYRVDTSTVPGAEVIAEWTDGLPLIAVRDLGISLRADLNFYPPSSDVRSDFWNVATDGDEILANALVWVAEPVVRVEPATWGAIKSLFRP